MNKRFTIVSVTLILSVLFSILFQSIHSFEHFSTLQTEKKCHHQYNSDKEITHQHHKIDHCFICDISFGNYITPELPTFQVFFEKTNFLYYLDFPETITVFSGSNYLLRGPPQFIA